MDVTEQLERELFLEYTEQYDRFYKGTADNEDYIKHLEKCLKVFTQLNSDNSDTKIEELYLKEDVDFETTLQTLQQFERVFTEDTTTQSPDTTISPTQTSL